MNIWLLTIGEQLPLNQHIRKLRTAYLADEFIARGHSIVWWASAFDHFKKKWLFDEDTLIHLAPPFTIMALKGMGYKKNISLPRFLDHRLIARKFSKMALRQPKPDIIIASMPAYDLAYEAVKFGQRFNIPVLVDIRDQWPDIFVDKSPLPKKITRLALTREFTMLQKVMRGASGITSVSETFMEWGLQYAGRQKTEADQVFYLGYKKTGTPKTTSDRIFQEKMDSLKGKFVVVFIGTFEAFHHPGILIDCAHLLQHEKGIHFVLAGDGSLMGAVKEKAAHLDNVTLTGWIDQEQINVLLSLSNVGVCPSNQVADLFPNKTFSYLAFDLPILSAFQGDLKKFIEERRIGYYYHPGDVNGLVNAIKMLYTSPNVYQQCSVSSSQLFSEKFDGDIIYRRFAEHVETLAMRDRRLVG